MAKAQAGAAGKAAKNKKFKKRERKVFLTEWSTFKPRSTTPS